MKKIFFGNWNSWGVNSGVTQFHTQFTLVFRHFELCKENKKNSSGKTFLKMWSQILGNMAALVQEISLKKKK